MITCPHCHTVFKEQRNKPAQEYAEEHKEYIIEQYALKKRSINDLCRELRIASNTLLGKKLDEWGISKHTKAEQIEIMVKKKLATRT